MQSQRSVVTVGNFDGVHLGHRALISAAHRLAAGSGNASVAAITFAHHPLTQLKPAAAPAVLTDAAQRAAELALAGADQIVWLEPTPDVLGLSPRQFVQRIVDELRPIGWVEGADFRFGKDRGGDIELLRELGREHGFEVEVVEPVSVTLRDKSRVAVSSTLVRWMVACGRVADTQLCLGRPYAIRGEVVRGEQRGRAFGFPTANLDTGEYQLPADGVYGGTVELDGRTFAAAISMGVKPTFGRRERCFEVYLLDFAEDLYGRTIEVKLARWLRDQAIFPGVEPLIEQMNRDVEQIRRLHESGRLSAAELVAGGMDR